MAYKVIVTDSADHDIDSALAYIINELHNIDAGISLADAIEEKYDVLADNPLVYEQSRHALLSKRGYRRIVIGNYVLLYLVDEDNKTVTIARLFYGWQNYAEYV